MAEIQFVFGSAAADRYMGLLIFGGMFATIFVAVALDELWSWLKRRRVRQMKLAARRKRAKALSESLKRDGVI